jgi:hypothetical protein
MTGGRSYMEPVSIGRPFQVAQLAIDAVVSMGRRNTQLEPDLH